METHILARLAHALTSAPWARRHILLLGAFAVLTSCSANTASEEPIPPATISVSANVPTSWTIDPNGLAGEGSYVTHTVAPPADGASYIIRPVQLTGYTLTATSSDGATAELFMMPGDSKTFYLSYQAIPKPQVTLTATPSSILNGESSSLLWNATGAIACSAVGGWTSSIAVSGSVVVQPTISTNYAITCSGAGGSTTASTSVSVTARPRIVLSTTSIAFTAIRNGSSPPLQSLQITQAGAGTLHSLEVEKIYGSTGGWLEFALNSTHAPATLSLIVVTTDLVPGEYTASVDIKSPTATNTPQRVAVTYSVTGEWDDSPQIGLSRDSLDFAAPHDASGLPGTLPPAREITVTNTGSGALKGLTAMTRYSTGSDWLSATLNGSEAPTVLVVQPTSVALQPGTYSGTIDLSSPGSATRSISIVYTVTDP